MQRTEPHEIDTRAQRVLEYKLPSNLVVRRQTSDDYGIDAEIELFVEGQSTGTIFKIQLKGQKEPKVSVDGKSISYTFLVSRGTYLIEQIEIPTIFILVDVSREIVYWSDIHSNNELVSSYHEAKSKGQDSFTIYFATDNTLPDTLRVLLDTVVISAHHIALRRVARIIPPVYADFTANLSSVDDELRHLSQKYEIANAEKLRRFIQSESYDEAERLIDAILSSSERSHEAKFDAFLHVERIFIGKYGGQKGDMTKVEFDLWIANELTALANAAGNERLMELAKAFTLSADLFFLVNRDMALFHNWRMHHDAAGKPLSTSDTLPYWSSLLKIERTRVERMVLDTYESMMSEIPLLIERDWVSVPDVITRAIFSMSIFLLRLKEENLTENVTAIGKSINGLIDFTVAVAEQMPQVRERDAIFDRCVIAYEMQLTAQRENDLKKQEIQAMALGVLDRISDKHMKTKARARLDESIRKVNEEVYTSAQIDWNALEEHYRRQAKVFGIDLSLAEEKIYDRDHPRYLDAQIAWIINIGIQDLNPTRILRNCKHLVYDYSGGIGEPAKVLRLPSARSKVMGCILHLEHGAIGAYSLDDIYAKFSGEHCINCADQAPHEDSWQYSSDWHERQIEAWKKKQADYRRRKQS